MAHDHPFRFAAQLSTTPNAADPGDSSGRNECAAFPANNARAASVSASSIIRLIRASSSTRSTSGDGARLDSPIQCLPCQPAQA